VTQGRIVDYRVRHGVHLEDIVAQFLLPLHPEFIKILDGLQ
jgi:hypothetical protein